MKYDLIIYTSFSNPYMRLVRVTNGKQWDVTNSVESRAATWADTDTPLSSDSNIGGIPITIPSALPAGEFDLLLYDAATATDTDVVQKGKRIQWTGKQLLGLPQDL